MTNIKTAFAFLTLLIIYNKCEASLYTQFKFIRGNAKNFTVENVQREQDLEYPGRDHKIRKILQKMWEDYYKCLEEKQNEDRKPEIRRLLEGQYTELQCNICQRPFQNYEEIEWKFKPLEASQNIREPQYLDLTPEMTLTENKTLKIFNAMETFAGLYVCYHEQNVISVYILEVSKNDTIEKIEKMQPDVKQSIRIEGYGYQIYYQWTEWTDCSTCGKVGRKFKYGTCFISPLFGTASEERYHYRTHRSQYSSLNENAEVTENLDELKKIKTLNQKVKLNQKLLKKVFEDNSTSEDSGNKNWPPEIMEKFKYGIPCASNYLPTSTFEYFTKLTAVKGLVKYCLEPCQENEIFEVLDNLGRVVEIANNTAGIYSVFQKLPQLPPDIERRSVEGEFGKDITIHCPSTSRSNTPIVWKVNKKIIFPQIIANESKGRIVVDLVHRIHIKKLRLKDSQIFSCWQKSRLVGTVRLNVNKKFKISFNHHVTLIGILAVIGIFLLVENKILSREIKNRK